MSGRHEPFGNRGASALTVTPHEIYHFGRFSLDVARGCLHCKDREIVLRPKSYAVLTYLVERADRLISKDELMQAVWPKQIVTDDSRRVVSVRCARHWATTARR